MEQKLKEIIEKAIPFRWYGHKVTAASVATGEEIVILLDDQLYYNVQEIELDSIIFSHEFAKAYFGEKDGIICIGGKDPECGYEDCGKVWQYHLQQLAITKPEERINYLYKHL